MSPSDKQSDSDALAWTAEQYVLGELPGGELTAFEARLESDFAAQVAVANAVQRVAGVASALSVPAPVTAASSSPAGGLQPWSKPLLGLAASIAIILSVGGTFWFSGRIISNQNEIAWAADEEVLTEIAEEWSQVREETASFAGWQTCSDNFGEELDNERDRLQTEPAVEWLWDDAAAENPYES